jgi:hypothetical protein
MRRQAMEWTTYFAARRAGLSRLDRRRRAACLYPSG